MFNYPGMSTADLIELLFEEGDRVTLEHIEELVSRGEEAAGPLREILVDEEYWYEGQAGAFWIEMHVVTILAMMKDLKSLPDLLEMVSHAYFSDHQRVIEILPGALAMFGEQAVEPLIDRVLKLKGAHRDNFDYSYIRGDMLEALEIIAGTRPSTKPRITGFFLELFADPEEDDRTLLAMATFPMLRLDYDRGREVIKKAYDRAAIDEEYIGDFDELIADFLSSTPPPQTDVIDTLRDFYRPESIASRQRQWAEEEGESHDKKDYPQGLWPGPAQIISSAFPHPEIPAGYVKTGLGNAVREVKAGRNDPCPCGSGDKYKKCCGKN